MKKLKEKKSIVNNKIYIIVKWLLTSLVIVFWSFYLYDWNIFKLAIILLWLNLIIQIVFYYIFAIIYTISKWKNTFKWFSEECKFNTSFWDIEKIEFTLITKTLVVLVVLFVKYIKYLILAFITVYLLEITSIIIISIIYLTYTYFKILYLHEIKNNINMKCSFCNKAHI